MMDIQDSPVTETSSSRLVSPGEETKKGMRALKTNSVSFFFSFFGSSRANPICIAPFHSPVTETSPSHLLQKDYNPRERNLRQR